MAENIVESLDDEFAVAAAVIILNTHAVLQQLLLLLQLFYGPLDCVWDYLGEPVLER